MAIFTPFCPGKGAAQNLTTSGSSQSVTIDAVAKSVRVVNTGATNGFYVRIGKGSQTCTSADTFVRANSEIILAKGDGEDTLAYLQNTGATTVQVQTGEGGL